MQTAQAQSNSTQPNVPPAPDAHLTATKVRVKDHGGYWLHWPKDFASDTFGSRSRGGPGYVVDWADPLEHTWCKGQEHKLENVPQDELEKAEIGERKHPEAIRTLSAVKTALAQSTLAAQQQAGDEERAAALAQPPVKKRGPKNQTFSEIEG